MVRAEYDKSLLLMNTMRKLWEQHIMWTRSFIISTIDGLKDLDAVTARLLRNPEDFASVLRMFYGHEKANKFKELFTEHLLIAAALVNAAKAGDAKAVEVNRIKWYKNAEDIAIFLSGINPYWNKNEWLIMLDDHLKMTELEAVQRLKGQYTEDIATYAEIENMALKMADYMAMGIKKQFKLY